MWRSYAVGPNEKEINHGWGQWQARGKLFRWEAAGFVGWLDRFRREIALDETENCFLHNSGNDSRNGWVVKNSVSPNDYTT